MRRETFLARFPRREPPPQPPAVAAWEGGADPEAFLDRLRAAGGEARRAVRDDWVDQVLAVAEEWGAGQVVASAEGRLAPAVDALRGGGLGVAVAGDPGFREAAAAADLGLTGARWALASTGTVVLAASPESPRMASLLPRSHLAVVWADDLLPDLAALARAVREQGTSPSAVTLVTGPSRTADIEQTLVVGVHGPGRMGAILVG